MDLDLHTAPDGTSSQRREESPSSVPTLSDRFSLAPLSWWFWVKAGMGFTLGAGFVSLVALAVWRILLLSALRGLAR
jgi:hypothetical protein